MTTITPTAPEQGSVTPETGKYATLALACYVFEPEHGSNLLRRALKASILADWDGMSPDEAIGEVMYGYTSRVREAGQEADRLIDQARRAALAAEMDGAA